MRSTYKIYIAGRVTGLPREEAKRNFNRGVKMIMGNGWDFINPLDHVPEGATPREAMTILLPLLVDEKNGCNAILLLNDAQFSEGAQLEESLARYCGLQLFYEDDLTQ